MRQFKTRIGLLNNTIAYYWDKPERRCAIPNPAYDTNSIHSKDICQYTPTETSDGCAIGRLVSPKTAKLLAVTNGTIIVDSQFNLLPNWLQLLGKDFLRSLQRLHDEEDLTTCDKSRINELMSYHVDITKIKFPKIN